MSALFQLSRTITRWVHDCRWTHITLVGHSIGATLAFTIATGDSLTVDSVKVISGGFVALFDVARQPDRSALSPQIDPKVRRTALQFELVGRLGGLVGPALRLANRAKLTPWVAGAMYANASKLPPGVQRSISENFSADAVRNTLALGRVFPAADVYKQVTAPVVNVWGDRDPLVSAPDSAYLERVLPTYTGAEIVGAGHCAHIERPHAVLSALFEAVPNDEG